MKQLCLLVLFSALLVPLLLNAQNAGTALQFNGVDQYADLGNSSLFNFDSSNFTISFWANPNYAGGAGNYDHVIGKAAPSSITPFLIGINDFKWKFWSSSDPVNGWDIAVEFPFADVTNNVWQYITVTRNQHNIIFYVNGKQTATFSTTLALWQNSESVLIGKIPYESAETYYCGMIDEVSFWNTSRTASEIQESMYGQQTGIETGLIANWHCNEGGGSVMAETKGANHGTLFNSPQWVVSTFPISSSLNTQIVSVPSEVNFTTASLFAAFQSKSGTDTISVVQSSSNIQGTTPAGPSTFHNRYWIIRSTANGTFSADLTFGLGAKSISLNDQEHPSNIQLYRREIGSYGAWVLVGTAARASFGSATFEGITEFGEFAVGTSTDSPLSGTGGVFQSTASGIWGDAASWFLIGGSDDDGIPDSDDDVIIRAGENIQLSSGVYTNNILLLGASSGTRLSISDYVGLYIYGTLNSDDTTLSSNLITTGTGANFNFVGSGRQVIGNHWSGDVAGWTVNFSTSDTARVLTNFKAGTIGISGPIKFGTYDAPKDLYVDGGTENSGSLSVNGTYLFVSGNITRNETYTSKFNNFSAAWSVIELGGTYLSAEQIRIGWPDYWYAVTNTLRVRAVSGLLINSASYGHMGTLEYIGTSAQTSGNELIGISNITIKNPSGVQFLSSVNLTNLYLDTGNVSLPADITLIVNNLYAKSYSILGAGNVNVLERVETAHVNGLPGVFQNTGTTSLTNYGETMVFNGTSVQQTGTLRTYFKDIPNQYISFIVDNPAGVTFNGSYAGNTLTLTNGNLTVNSPDTLTFNTLTAGTNEIHGTGMYIQKMGSLATAHPNGIDGTIQTTNYSFDAPVNGGMTFNGVLPQSTGMRMPDSLGGLTILNSSGFTFTKSIFLPSFDMYAQACDLTLPFGQTFRTGNFNGGQLRKISGGGNFFLTKGGYFSTNNISGINGILQLTGDVNFGDSSVFAFLDAGGLQATGSMLPDTLQSIYFSNTTGSTISKPFSVRTTMVVQNGPVDNSVNNAALWEGATLQRNGGGSLAVTPKFQNYYDVNYAGWAGNSGPEIPDSTTVLRNLLGANWITLTKNATVNGTLMNYVRTDSFTLRVLGSIPWNFMVAGHLGRFISTAKEYVWEVADKDAQRYHPFTLNAAALQDSGDIIVTLCDTAVVPLPSIPPGQKLLRYYHKTDQHNIIGLNGTISMIYNDGDVNNAGIPDDDSLTVMQWKNGTWDYLDILSRDKYNNRIIAGPVDTLTTFIITGTEKKGIATFSRKEIHFGNVLRPEMKYDTLYIKNTGTWPLQLYSIGFADPWTFGGSLGSYTIPVGDSVYFAISFNAFHGGISSNIYVTHNGTTGVDTVSLTGKAIYPELSFSSGYPGFGTVPVGDSKKDSVMLYNTGLYQLVISEVVISSPHFIATTEKDTIAPSDSAKLYITFAPQAEGSFNEWITVRNNIYNSGDGYRIYPNGIATASLFAVLPTELTFGDVHRGQSKTDSVQVKNPGAAILHITNIAASVGGYTASPASFDVPSGDSVWVTVTFAPQSQGNFNGELIFNHSATTTTPDSVHLSGTGIEQIYSADKSSFSFGSVTVGNTRKDSLSVTNTGNIALHITSAVSSDPSQFSVTPSSAVIAAGEKQKFYFAFMPNQMGTQTGTVKFTHDGISDTNIVSVSGFGQVPVFTASRRVIDLGEVRIDSTRKDTITVTNTGNASLAVTSVASSDSEFVITPQSVILSPGSKKEFTIAFSPRRPEGTKETKFIFSHNGNPNKDTLRFSGQAVEPIFSADASLNVAPIRKGMSRTDTLTVYNNGSMPLTISSVVAAADTFSITPKSAVVPKNGSAIFIVTFSPTARGHFSDRFIFTHDGQKHFDTVTVQGMSIEPLFGPQMTRFHFDSVRVNRQKKDSVWIRNDGNASLTITSVVSGDAQVTITPVSLVLPAGDSSKFMITMKPVQRGMIDAKLVVTHDADSNPDTLFVDGVGVEPLFAASESSLNFGDVAVDSTKLDSITVSNPGNIDLLMYAQRPANGVYAIHPESTVVFKGSSRTIYVSFTPSVRGSVGSTITFLSTADSSPDTVSLLGRGIAPVFAANRTTVDFGSVRIGTLKMDSISLKNNGNAPLNITSASVGDTSLFSVTPNSAAIAPSESLWFRIMFKSSTMSNVSSQIQFEHNGKPSSNIISVSGRGFMPTFSAKTKQLHFVEVRIGTMKKDSIEITNNGNSTLFVSSYATSDSEFIATPDSFSLEANAKRNMLFTFTPKFRSVRTGSIFVYHNADSAPDTMSMSGTGIEPLFAASILSLDFGEVRIDSIKMDSIIISNPGNMDLKISNIHPSGAVFSVQPESLIIPKGGTGKLFLSLKPTAQLSYSGRISFVSNASSSPDTIGVKGRGIAPVFAVNKSSVDFGGVRIGNFKTDSVCVKNTGTASLTIRSVQSLDKTSFTVKPLHAMILPSDSAWFRIMFTASERTEHASKIEFLHDAVPGADSIDVKGHGILPIFAASVEQIQFGELRLGKTVSDSILISNPGNSPLIVSSVMSRDSQFTVIPDSFTVQPNEAHMVKVRFAPVVRGERSSFIILTHNAEPSSDTVLISGNGIEPLFISSKQLINFGAVRTDSSRVDSIEISNPGNMDLHISFAHSLHPVFSVMPESTIISRGASQYFIVSFDPSVQGKFSSVIKFKSDAVSSPDSIAVEGTGIAPVFAKNRNGINFGGVAVGYNRTDSLFVKNIGTAPLFIHSVNSFDTVRFSVEPKQALIHPADSQAFRVTYHSTEMAVHTSTVEFLHDGISGKDTLNVTGHGLMPLYSASAKSVTFGEVRIGSSRRDSVEITNAGNSALLVSSVTVNDSQFVVQPDSFTVPANGNRKLHIKFTPDHRGINGSSFIVHHNAASGVDTISLNGTGIEPLFFAKRSQIDFGMMEKDSLRTDTVEVVNHGNTFLLIDSVSTYNGIASVSPKNASIAKGDSLRFAVTIHPLQTGSLNGYVKFHNNAPVARDTVYYRVDVGPPVFTLNTREVKFRTTLTGKHRTDTLKIFNDGFFDLNISSVSISDSSFVVSIPTQTVKAQTMQPFAVTFSPKTTGSKNGMVIFTHNTKRQSDTLFLSGKGVELTTIAQARVMNTGSEAVIEGTVTRTKGILSFIQDSTGALSILPSQQWWSDSLSSGGIAPGDVVRIGGVISESNFLKQIAVNDSIEFVRVLRKAPLPKAEIVTLAQLKKNGEHFESKLILLKGASIINTADTVFSPLTSYSIVDASDSTQSVMLRIGAAEQTDIDGRRLPKKNFNFVGILSQSHLSDSGKGYQLLPLLNTDLESDPTTVQEWAVGVPTEYILYNNFPNPFNPSTTIRFGVPEASSVKIEVFDILGRKVTELFNDRMDAGYQQIVWRATAASGVYLYRIESRSISEPNKVFVNVKKMMLLK